MMVGLGATVRLCHCDIEASSNHGEALRLHTNWPLVMMYPLDEIFLLESPAYSSWVEDCFVVIVIS